jgi:hypothetical protein
MLKRKNYNKLEAKAILCKIQNVWKYVPVVLLEDGRSGDVYWLHLLDFLLTASQNNFVYTNWYLIVDNCQALWREK